MGGAGGRGGRRRAGSSNGTLSEINIIPLVDVVLVLLIIFMLTAHVMEFGLEIKVPEVKQEVKNSTDDLPVISVTRDAKIFLNERPVNLNQIPEEIKKRFKKGDSVYLMADASTVWDPIVQVISTLNKAGIQIKVVAKPQESTGRR